MGKRQQKGYTNLDFNEVGDDHLDHMQIICTSLQTDNLASTSSLHFGRPFLHRFALRYRAVVLSVCLSVLDVTLVLWPLTRYGEKCVKTHCFFAI